MYIEAIMSTNVVTVDIDDNLFRVRKIFASAKLHHLVVVNQGKLAGVISDRDFLRAISPSLDTPDESLKDHASLKKKVSEIMTREVVAVNKNVLIQAAAQLMLKKGVGCLPVATEAKSVMGIVTLKDILKYYIMQNSQKSGMI